MDLGAYIPQFFYDLIGRAVPGATVMACALLSFEEPKESFLRLVTWSDSSATHLLPVTLILLGALLVSYVVGALLGGFWFLICDLVMGGRGRGASSEPCTVPKVDVRITNGRPEILHGWLSYVYDYVQLCCPKAGSRIAKLRAEFHMCGVMIVGCSLLLMVNVVRLLPAFQGPPAYVHILLPVIVLGAASLAWHLDRRGRRGLANLWILCECHKIEER